MEKLSEVNRQRWKLLKSLEKFLEVPMMVLGFIWLVLLIIELTSGLPRSLEVISIVIWGMFIVDFLLSVLIAPDKKLFLKRNLITMISLLIPAFRMLRIFRILRLLRGLRLAKVLTSLNRSMRILTGTMRRRGVVYVLILTLIIVFVGAAGMYAFEQSVNRGFASYGDAVWWTAMVVITVGSDYWPRSPEGRVLTYLLALYGFAVLGYITATIATFFLGQDDQRMQPDKEISRLSEQIEELKAMIRKLQ